MSKTASTLARVVRMVANAVSRIFSFPYVKKSRQDSWFHEFFILYVYRLPEQDPLGPDGSEQKCRYRLPHRFFKRFLFNESCRVRESRVRVRSSLHQISTPPHEASRVTLLRLSCGFLIHLFAPSCSGTHACRLSSSFRIAVKLARIFNTWRYARLIYHLTSN